MAAGAVTSKRISTKSPVSPLAPVPTRPYRPGMDPILRTILAAIPPAADRRRVALALINAGLSLLRETPGSGPASDPLTRTPDSEADDR